MMLFFASVSLSGYILIGVTTASKELFIDFLSNFALGES